MSPSGRQNASATNATASTVPNSASDGKPAAFSSRNASPAAIAATTARRMASAQVPSAIAMSSGRTITIADSPRVRSIGSAAPYRPKRRLRRANSSSAASNEAGPKSGHRHSSNTSSA